jgi:hypothetical protein
MKIGDFYLKLREAINQPVIDLPSESMRLTVPSP